MAGHGPGRPRRRLVESRRPRAGVPWITLYVRTLRRVRGRRRSRLPESVGHRCHGGRRLRALTCSRPPTPQIRRASTWPRPRACLCRPDGLHAAGEAGVRSGMTVAVQGLGGLGHLGVQYARALGARVVGITRTSERNALRPIAPGQKRRLTHSAGPGKALRRLGGADLILTTVTTAAAIAPLLDGLKPRGTLALVGAAPETIPIVPMYVVSRRLRIIGSIIGNRRQMREVLDVAVRHNVRPRIERIAWSRCRRFSSAWRKTRFAIARCSPSDPSGRLQRLQELGKLCRS